MSQKSFFKAFRGTFLSTEPVLTETVYLLGPNFDQQKHAIDFILQGGVTLVPQSLESLARARTLMDKYSDVPMDLADATLVAHGEEMGIEEIFTFDKRGFETYRMDRNTAFTLWP